jgi:hypothetical protein
MIVLIFASLMQKLCIMLIIMKINPVLFVKINIIEIISKTL